MLSDRQEKQGPNVLKFRKNGFLYILIGLTCLSLRCIDSVAAFDDDLPVSTVVGNILDIVVNTQIALLEVLVIAPH